MSKVISSTTTVTNGVEITEENLGKLIEMTTTVTYSKGPDRVTLSAGYLDSIRPSQHDRDAEYVYFRDGHIGGIAQTLFGHPTEQICVRVLVMASLPLTSEGTR